MRIISSAFKDNEAIPAKFTCDGLNVNPSLEFLDVPEHAASLALLVDDPDAPGGDFVHWLVFNMDSNLNRIMENSLPDAATEGLNDFQANSYGGPCPPNGKHRYYFKLYALDTFIDLGSQATKADFLEAIDGHIIDTAQILGHYERQTLLI